MRTTDSRQAQDKPPQLDVVAQYVKYFSFENPNAPWSLTPTQGQPTINIQVNVAAKPLADLDVEVEIKLNGVTEAAGVKLFSFDLAYAGVFRIQYIPEESIPTVVMIDCPQLLFPFAREVVATAVGNAGFPPLLINPVDFVGLCQRKIGGLWKN